MKKVIIMFAAIVLFVGCKKENLISLPVLSKTLTVNENYMIPAASKDPITYTSANEYAVQVSETGKITARHYTGVGTEVKLTSKDDSKSFVVHVAPRNTLYTEPNITFGQLKGTLSLNPNTLVSSVESADLYAMGGGADYLLVAYTSADRVDYYAVLVPLYNKGKLDIFLADRYERIGTDNGVTYYRDALTATEAKMMIAVEWFDYNGFSYWVAMYARYPHGRSCVEPLLSHCKGLLH